MATTPPRDDDELRTEYSIAELKGGVRGKYYARYKASRRMVHLDPDVAAVFSTDESVNDALRLLIDVARRQAQSTGA